MKRWLLITIFCGLLGAPTRALPQVLGDVEVTNLKPGMTVPRVFHVQGRALAHARITVTIISALWQTHFVERSEQEEQTKRTCADDAGVFDLEFDGRRLLIPEAPLTVFVQSYDGEGHPGPITSFAIHLQ